MSKKKLAAIIIPCVIAIIVLAVMFSRLSTPASLTPSEQSYMGTVLDHGSNLSEALDNIYDLMGNQQISYDQWTTDVGTQLAAIRVLCDEAVEIEPPVSMGYIQNKYLQAIWHINKFVDLMAEGLNSTTSDLIGEAMSEVTVASEYYDEVLNLTSDFVAAHSH